MKNVEVNSNNTSQSVADRRNPRVDLETSQRRSSDNTWLSSLDECLTWHAETMAAETEAGKGLVSVPVPSNEAGSDPFERFLQSLVREVCVYFGRGYVKGNDHIVDAVRCAMLAHEQATLDTLSEETVSVMPVFTDPVFI